MLLRHATAARNLPGIIKAGLLTSKSQGKLLDVWLHSPSCSAWAGWHTVRRHGGRIEGVVILEIDVQPRHRKGELLNQLFPKTMPEFRAGHTLQVPGDHRDLPNGELALIQQTHRLFGLGHAVVHTDHTLLRHDQLLPLVQGQAICKPPNEKDYGRSLPNLNGTLAAFRLPRPSTPCRSRKSWPLLLPRTAGLPRRAFPSAGGGRRRRPAGEALGVRRVVAAHRVPQDAVQRVLVRLVRLVEVHLKRLLRPVQRRSLQPA
jgi:hypothetical protein